MQWKIIKLNQKNTIALDKYNKVTTPNYDKKIYVFGGTTLMVVFELTRLHFAALIKGQINVLFGKRFSEQGRRW